MHTLKFLHFYLFWSAFNFFLIFKFIYFESDRDSTSQGGAEREGKRESQAGSAMPAQSPTWGTNPQTVRS